MVNFDVNYATTAEKVPRDFSNRVYFKRKQTECSKQSRKSIQSFLAFSLYLQGELSMSLNQIFVNPYWQITGTFLRPFYWKSFPGKLIQSSIGEFWITHPKEGISSKIIFHEFWGHTDRFTGKLIQSVFWNKSYMICNIWSG